MAKLDDMKLDKGAVARAIRPLLARYYEAIQQEGYDEEASGRPDVFMPDEALSKAIFKSRYVTKHLDWGYLVELVYAVLEQNDVLAPEAFAQRLEAAIASTATQREFVAIYPLAFQQRFSLLGREKALTRAVTIDEFTISPPAASVNALNKLTRRYEAPPIDASSFAHGVFSSHKSLSRDVLVTFAAHGTEDQLRFSTLRKFTTLCRLIELFAVLFGEGSMPFTTTYATNHCFLLNKRNGELRRFPTLKASAVKSTLNHALLKSMRRPEFAQYLEAITSTETMYGRLRNAIHFFSKAYNEHDRLSSFLFYVIAMESIFSRDKHTPIKVTLADFGALLCYPPAQRAQAHTTIRELYDTRSGIVHSGSPSVDTNDVSTTKGIAARAIYCSLALCQRLKGEGKLEDRFFNHLRDLRLGLVKHNLPQALRMARPIGTDEDE